MQGYHGCAIGKAKQAAKTEIEKLKVMKFDACQPVRSVLFTRDTIIYNL